MCRNIRTLYNFKPPATDGRANPLNLRTNCQPAFDRAVKQVAQAARELLDSLVTDALPRDREVEAAKARARAANRFGSSPAPRGA